MNIWDIAKKVGLGMLTTAVPGAGALIGVVNGLLPDDDKLPETATGQQLEVAINNLPADKRAELMLKEFDVDIEQIKQSHDTVRVMLESDAQNPQSTRPKIAWASFQVLAFIHIAVAAAWCVDVITHGNPDWAFVLALTTPFVVLLKAYFGVLETEHKNKLQAAGGGIPTAQSGIIGALSSIFSKK